MVDFCQPVIERRAGPVTARQGSDAEFFDNRIYCQAASSHGGADRQEKICGVSLETFFTARCHRCHAICQRRGGQFQAMLIDGGKSHHIFHVITRLIKRDCFHPDIR